jgi:hypothetical protein
LHQRSHATQLTIVAATAAAVRTLQITAWCELRALYPLYHWRLLLVDASYPDSVESVGQRVWQVMQPSASVMDFNIALAFWTAAGGKYVLEVAALNLIVVRCSVISFQTEMLQCEVSGAWCDVDLSFQQIQCSSCKYQLTNVYCRSLYL